jgi:hypothetical protein
VRTTLKLHPEKVPDVAKATWDIGEYDLSQLRAHVREMHPRMVRDVLARGNTDLAAQHARQHTRYRTYGHNHVAGRITISIGGLPVEYDEGWITGQGVLAREAALARIRQPLRGTR